MAHKKVIVTTTINPPTKALKKFAAMSDWHLVSVGDLKTPKDFEIPGTTYLSPADQEKMDPTLSEMIGWNCIQRRNFGLIWAHQNGAEVIAVVDDDNIPYDFWGKDCLVNREVELDSFDPKGLAFDPVSVTNYPHLWHRGYPIQWLTDRVNPTKRREKILVDVDAGFWNGDPDIDAVCRMEHAPNVEFSDSTFPLTSRKIAPFNSQNTMISRRALPEYFLFPRIGRMDDIWAAFWLQAKGFRIAFSKASVFQERNVHDLTRDFEAEVLGYTKSHAMLRDLAQDPDAIWKYLPENSRAIYQRYRSHLK